MSADSFVTTDPSDAVRHATLSFTARPVEIAPRLFVHPLFVNAYALDTGDGLLLVDPGLAQLSDVVHAAVRRWWTASATRASPEFRVHTAIYTHGHADHAFGLKAFIDAGHKPRIIAQENVLARFARYRLTHGWNARINQRQFGLPRPEFPSEFIEPTLTFRSELRTTVGDLDVHCFAARGETDDHCIVWIPQRRILFCGDLIIWQAPNCGNPQKVQRYPDDWARALVFMAELGAEYLCPGHGHPVHGVKAVRDMLLNTAAYLRHLCDTVLARMNAGEMPDAICETIEPDPTLAKLPYLRPGYDHPTFIARNLCRLWGGWWGGDPSQLLPPTRRSVADAVCELAGGVDRVVSRARQLLDAGDSKLAAVLAEWAVRTAPDNLDAQRLRRDVYVARGDAEIALMAQGVYRAAANDARVALGEKTESGPALTLTGIRAPASRL